MVFELPSLDYEYNALEPHIDAKTMEIHHNKHHAGYVKKLNAALEKHPELTEKPVEDILKSLESVPDEIKTAVRNNGGGVANHNMFWQVMTPDENKRKLDEKLKKKIEKTFGSVEEFRKKFTEAAMTKFGSGWAWLVLNPDGKLEVTSTSNQDSPVSEGKTPILCLDVWEHAYYLKYQNKRDEYVENWWNVVNWAKVKEFFENSG